MKNKIIVGLIILVVFLAAVALRQFNPFIVDMLVLFMLTIAGIEVAKALSKKYDEAILGAVAFYPIFAFGAYYLGTYFEHELGLRFLNGLTMILLTVVAYFLVLLLIKALSRGRITRDSLFVTMFSIIYPCTLGMFFVALNRVGGTQVLYDNTTFGATPIALLLAVSSLSDVAAYFVGSFLKGPKLAPKLSPKKTISGAIGGLFGGWIGAVAIMLIARTGFIGLLPLSFASGTGPLILHSALIGVIGSVFTQFGDLIASAIKRDVGIKDYGKLLGSHGGIMDRFDGQLFNAFYLYIYIAIAGVL